MKKKYLAAIVLLLVAAIAGGTALFLQMNRAGIYYDSYAMEKYVEVADYQRIIAEKKLKERDTENERESIFQEIIALSKVKDYPKREYKYRYENLDSYYHQTAEDLGYEDFAEFLKEQFQLSREEYEEHLEASTKHTITKELVVYRIAELEGVSVSDEAYAGHLAELLDHSGFDEKTYEERFGETIESYAERNGVRTELLKEKVMTKIFGGEKKDDE